MKSAMRENHHAVGVVLVAYLRAPVSATNSDIMRPFTTRASSVVRGWVWGVLKPQGLVNPTAKPIPLLVNAGRVSENASTSVPPLPSSLAPKMSGGEMKSNVKSESSRGLYERWHWEHL
jgi:hypothetical protein